MVTCKIKYKEIVYHCIIDKKVKDTNRNHRPYDKIVTRG